MSKAVQGAALLGAALVAGAFTLGVGGVALEAAFNVSWMAEAIISVAAGGASMEAGAIASALTSNRGMNITTRAAAANRQIIYGQQRVGGVTIYKSTTGSHRDQLNYVIVIAGHVCDSIVNLYLDGRQVYWAGGVGNVTRNGINFGGAADGNSHTGPNGVQYNFGGAVYAEARFGDQTSGENTVSQIMGSLRANDPLWDYDSKGNNPWVAGCTYLYIKVESNAGLFPSEPEIRVTVNGKSNIWDPRTQTSGFTSNWALIAADIITDTQFGLGDNTVNQANLIAAANVCDEQIQLANGQTEAQWACNYHYDTGVAPGDALAAIMPAAAGNYSQIGGQHYIWPAYWQGPSATFGAQHLTAPFSWKQYRSVPDRINRVNGTFTAPNFPYNVAGNLYDSNGFFNGQAQDNFSFAFQPTNFPQYAQDALHGYPSDEWLTADGGELHPLELSLTAVLSLAQAQRVAKIYLLRNRFEGTGTLEMSLAAYVMQPKDVFDFTFPFLNWNNKILEVSGASLSVSEDQESGAQSIRASFNVNETGPSIYEWSTAEELTIYDVPALPSQTPLTPAPPTSMALNSGPNIAIVQPDGSLESLIEVTFNTPLDNLAVQVQVQYQRVGASTWLSAPPIDISLNVGLISGVIAGAAYNVQIRSTRANGVSSEWVQQLNYTVSTTPSFLGTLGAQIPTITANSALGGTVPGEMLTNPNFVNGLTGWNAINVVESPTIDTSEHHLGTQSARLHGGTLNQLINLVAGHTYLFQGWLMTDGSVIGGGTYGAGLYVNDPSQQITVQKFNGTAMNLANDSPAALITTTTAIPWTLVQMTFSVATSGAYLVLITDNYGNGNAANAHVWFDGLSLTDTTGAADVTASQAIVYTGTTESIIPNGNFVLGNTQGWGTVSTGAGNWAFNNGAAGPEIQIVGGTDRSDGVVSPTFSVVPGAKYRVTFTASCSGGTQSVYFRISATAGNIANIQSSSSGVTVQDFLAGGSIAVDTMTDYAYDWTCPAGLNYASLNVYAWNNSNAWLHLHKVSCVPYGATGQWGADVTGSNTSADTSSVDGVPSSTIASVVPTGYKLFINSGTRSYSIQAV